MKIMIQVLTVKKTTFSTQFVDKAAVPSRLSARKPLREVRMDNRPKPKKNDANQPPDPSTAGVLKPGTVC